MSGLKKLPGIMLFLFVSLLIWAGLYSIPMPVLTSLESENNCYIHDLRGIDFKREIIGINSGRLWETHLEKLYTPQEFEETAAVDSDYAGVGCATHRLRLVLAPDETYGLSMRSFDYAMRIFINGVERDTVGVPGMSRETTIPRVDNRVYYFTADTEETEIVVQASNFVHREGANTGRMYLGSDQNISRKIQTDATVSSLIAGGLLLSALYHLALFLVNRRRTTELIFSVCCFLLFAFNQQIIFLFFPDYNWFVLFRIEYIVHYSIFAMLTLFIHRLFPGLLQRLIVNTFLIISGAAIIFTILADTVTSSHLIRYYDIVAMVNSVWILIRLALTLKKRRLQNLLAFAGLSIIFILTINDMLRYTSTFYPQRLWNMEFSTPVGMIFFVLCYAMALALDHAETERIALEATAKEQALRLEKQLVLHSYENTAKHLEQVGVIRHEMKNHIAAMSILMDGGEHEKTKNYLSKLLEQQEQVPQIKYCDNYLLNAILNVRLLELMENGVKVNHEIAVGKELNIPDEDLSSLIMNILDNAAEALAGSSVPKWMKLKIYTEKPYLYIFCENAKNNPVREANGEFLSTKSDSENHGHGLKIVRRIVEKRDGLLNISHTEHTFTVEAAVKTG